MNRNLQIKQNLVETVNEEFKMKNKIQKQLNKKKNALTSEIENLSQLPQTQLEETLPNPTQIFQTLADIEKRKKDVIEREEKLENQRQKNDLEKMLAQKKGKSHL